MEAIMALRDLITWGRDQPSVPSRRGEEVSPFLTLHREMNRLFDDVFNSFGNTPSLLGRMSAWPSVEVGPCCTDQGCGRNAPDPVLSSCNADELRASQLQHAVEHVDSHVHLGGPTLVRVR